MKKAILSVLIIIVVIILGVFVFNGSNNSNINQTATISTDDSAILFVGDGCPHCKIVEDFIDQNKVHDKVSFSVAEIFHNKGNQQIFVEKYKACGQGDTGSMGVPMLWADGKCYIGQEEAIKYFQDQISNK